MLSRIYYRRLALLSFERRTVDIGVTTDDSNNRSQQWDTAVQTNRVVIAFRFHEQDILLQPIERSRTGQSA